MKTICCQYDYGKLPHPVHFNSYNNAVMCHNCGEMYVPQLDRTKEEDAIAHSVLNECRKVFYLKWSKQHRPLQKCDKPKGHEGACSYKGYT